MDVHIARLNISALFSINSSGMRLSDKYFDECSLSKTRGCASLASDLIVGRPDTGLVNGDQWLFRANEMGLLLIAPFTTGLRRLIRIEYSSLRFPANYNAR